LRNAVAILLQKVPLTIITSDWRGLAWNTTPKAIEIVTAGSGLHHLDRTAGEAEGHGRSDACAPS
jgi:hypothetical protein